MAERQIGHWKSRLVLPHALPSSTDVPVLLLNQPNILAMQFSPVQDLIPSFLKPVMGTGLKFTPTLRRLVTLLRTAPSKNCWATNLHPPCLSQLVDCQ